MVLDYSLAQQLENETKGMKMEQVMALEILSDMLMDLE